MSGLFKLPISGLKEGHHFYDFELGNEFFEEFEGSEIREGNLSVGVELDKRTSHIDLLIKITGKVRLCCDRCLEMFLQPLECENRLVIKYGKTLDDSDPDIIIVPADEIELDIKQYLYEFIHLALPIKRIHPVDANGASTCDPEMLKKLDQHLVNENKMNDPRWDELKKLINNN
jgi:uncharacterized protein